MRRNLFFTLLSSILVIVLPALKQAGSTGTLQGQVELSKTGEPASISACLPEGDVSDALRKISSAQTYSEQQEAVALLRDDAGKGPICRTQVVGALVTAMDKPNLNLMTNRPNFYLWHYGSELLADLKAVEALDLLIKHLKLNDGSIYPLSHYPAVGALVDMGEIALPRLKDVLRQDPDRLMRRYAAFCVASIGGPSAKRVLREALVSESDQCVGAFIRASLDAFNNKTLPDYISSEKRTKWYSAWLCDIKIESVP
jgi:hypothetical protein